MKPRRWFRFSLRTMFVLLTVFGVWLSVQVKWVRNRAEFKRAHPEFFHRAAAWQAYSTVQAPWSIRLLGETGVAEVEIDYDYEQELKPESQAVKQQAKSLFPEAAVGPVGHGFKGF